MKHSKGLNRIFITLKALPLQETEYCSTKQTRFNISFINSDPEGLILGEAMPKKCNSLLLT
jgi:hypothetical protein